MTAIAPLTPEKEQALRKVFETMNRDSFRFARSRRGTYVNPAVARDWKWFLAGAEAQQEAK